MESEGGCNAETLRLQRACLPRDHLYSTRTVVKRIAKQNPLKIGNSGEDSNPNDRPCFRLSKGKLKTIFGKRDEISVHKC